LPESSGLSTPSGPISVVRATVANARRSDWSEGTSCPPTILVSDIEFCGPPQPTNVTAAVAAAIANRRIIVLPKLARNPYRRRTYSCLRLPSIYFWPYGQLFLGKTTTAHQRNLQNIPADGGLAWLGWNSPET